MKKAAKEAKKGENPFAKKNESKMMPKGKNQSIRFLILLLCYKFYANSVYCWMGLVAGVLRSVLLGLRAGWRFLWLTDRDC